MTKDDLRKIYLQKRIQLSDAEYFRVNKQLVESFFKGLDLSNVKVLHTFLPIVKTKEPDTWLIIERLRKDYPGIQISIPKINTQTALVDNFYYEGQHQLEKNTWGIPEPMQGVPTPTDKIDAVLVPLLAFDKKGNRVGYGRGFYDKLLATCKPDCKSIGLSFFEPVKEIEGIASYDIPLTMAVTPSGVLKLS